MSDPTRQKPKRRSTSRGSLRGRIASFLRQIGPYAAIELILPGGSLIALLLWLCRRDQRIQAVLGSWRAAASRTLGRGFAALPSAHGHPTRSPACA